MITANSSLAFAEVHAEITRAATGKTEKILLDRFETEEHAKLRNSLGVRLRGLARRVIPWVGIGLVALGAMLGKPDVMIAATVITNAGQAVVTNLVSGLGGTVPKYVAWGTGAGTAAITDTTLFTESSEEARTNGTPTRVTTTVTNDTYQVVGTITVVTSNKTITNVGLFDASTTGNLYFKSDFTGLALLIGDSITFTLKIKFS